MRFEFGGCGARLRDDDDRPRKIDVGIALHPHHEEGDDSRHGQTEEHDERRDRIPDGPGRDILEVHPLSPFRSRLAAAPASQAALRRSEEHTSELQSLMRISYAVFCLKKKKNKQKTHQTEDKASN